MGSERGQDVFDAIRLDIRMLQALITKQSSSIMTAADFKYIKHFSTSTLWFLRYAHMKKNKQREKSNSM